MTKTRNNFLLIIGLMAIFGLTAIDAFAQNGGRPRNTAILSVKTSPSRYIVRVDGVQAGMCGVGSAMEFYVTWGLHGVAIEGPNSKA